MALMTHVLESMWEPDAVKQARLSGALEGACSLPNDRSWNYNIVLF